MLYKSFDEVIYSRLSWVAYIHIPTIFPLGILNAKHYILYNMLVINHYTTNSSRFKLSNNASMNTKYKICLKKSILITNCFKLIKREYQNISHNILKEMLILKCYVEYHLAHEHVR